MKTLVIKESKWLNGDGEYSSILLDENGNMCCLGFLGKSCGASDNQLINIGTPVGTDNVNWAKELLDPIRASNSVLCQTIVSVNDDRTITLEERKSTLTELFKKLDIALEFVP